MRTSFARLLFIPMRGCILNILCLDPYTHAHGRTSSVEEGKQYGMSGWARKTLAYVFYLKHEYRVRYSVAGHSYLLKQTIMEIFEVLLQFLSLTDAVTTSSLTFSMMFSICVFANSLISPLLHWNKSLDNIVACDTVFDIAYGGLNSIRLLNPSVAISGLDIVQLLWPIYAVAHRLEDYSSCRMRDRHGAAGKTNSFRTQRKRRLSAIGLPTHVDHKHSPRYYQILKAAVTVQTIIGAIFCALTTFLISKMVVMNAHCAHT